MTPKQQFDRFMMQGAQSGYVPFHPILMHFAARFSGHTYGELASDYKVLVDCNIKAMEFFGADWVELISDPYRETSAFGANVEFIPEGVPKCLNHVVHTMDDVISLKNPDVYKAARTLDRIKGAELYQKLLKGTVPVFGWIEGPLAEACDLAGVSEMLMMLMVDPEFSNRLMDKCMVTAKDFAKAQIDAGCDVIGIGDAICSQVDADTYNAYVLDRHKELVAFIQSLGAKVKMHICGNISHLLPSLATLNLDILDIDWQVSFAEAFGLMGSNVAICGNINPVTIQDSEPQQIRSLTKSLIKDNTGKKLILSGGCEITVNTPVENLMEMGNSIRL